MIDAEMRNVSYTYSRGTPFEAVAVNNVTVSFEKGKITGVIGHTGSGKSTISQLLGGLLPATEGEVIICGENISRDRKHARGTNFKVGVVFQYPEYQLFDETVYKDIAFGPANMGLSEEETGRRVADAAMHVGLDKSLLSKSPFELSGGEKRRAAIAGVLAICPEILILDEPAAGLDPRGREEILRQIVNYRDKTGACIIMISHSMEDIAEYCDNILVMNKSRVFMYGTVGEVFSRAEELSEIGLGVPQVTKVLAELKKLGYDVNTSAFTVEDAVREIIRAGGGKKC